MACKRAISYKQFYLSIIYLSSSRKKVRQDEGVVTKKSSPKRPVEGEAQKMYFYQYMMLLLV